MHNNKRQTKTKRSASHTALLQIHEISQSSSMGSFHATSMLLDQSNHIIDRIIDTSTVYVVLSYFPALKYALSSAALKSDGFGGEYLSRKMKQRSG